jgi:PqqD family protein of HPr-rel-A system
VEQPVTGWRLADDLRIQIWDGAMVVYDRARGDTHCLDPVLSNVLEGLAASGEASEDALAEILQRVFGLPRDAIQFQLGVAMTELERLRLARPA